MDKNYSEQMLKVLESLKNHIAIETADGTIYLVQRIELAYGGEGFIFSLGDKKGQTAVQDETADQEQPERISTEQAVKDMQDEYQPGHYQASDFDPRESPDDKIRRHLSAIKPHIKHSRCLLIPYFSNVRAWVLNDLAKAFGCRGDEVAARAADYLGLTAENPENNGTASAEEEKNSAE